MYSDLPPAGSSSSLPQGGIIPGGVMPGGAMADGTAAAVDTSLYR